MKNAWTVCLHSQKSIHLSSYVYPESGHGGSSQSRETQTSLPPALPGRSLGVPRPAERHRLSSVSWVFSTPAVRTVDKWGPMSIFKWTTLQLDQAVFSPKGICLIWRLICDELRSSTNIANPRFSFYCLISISGSLFNLWLQHGRMRKWALLTLTLFTWRLWTEWILRLLVNAMFTAQAPHLASRLCSLAPLLGRKDMQD